MGIYKISKHTHETMFALIHLNAHFYILSVFVTHIYDFLLIRLYSSRSSNVNCLIVPFSFLPYDAYCPCA